LIKENRCEIEVLMALFSKTIHW